MAKLPVAAPGRLAGTSSLLLFLWFAVPAGAQRLTIPAYHCTVIDPAIPRYW